MEDLGAAHVATCLQVGLDNKTLTGNAMTVHLVDVPVDVAARRACGNLHICRCSDQCTCKRWSSDINGLLRRASHAASPGSVEGEHLPSVRLASAHGKQPPAAVVLVTGVFGLHWVQAEDAEGVELQTPGLKCALQNSNTIETAHIGTARIEALNPQGRQYVQVERTIGKSRKSRQVTVRLRPVRSIVLLEIQQSSHPET